MLREWHRRMIQLAGVVIAVSLMGVMTACGYKACRDGETGRFRCDPSAASSMPQQTDDGRALT